jgi:hypothetical protein
LERDVIATILRPVHPVMEALRAQLAVCRTKSREFTGVGFYTQIVVPQALAVANIDRLILTDVHADIDGIEHEAGFVLWIEGGMLDTLEGFTYDGPWPEVVEGHRVFGEHAAGNTLTDLEEVEAALERRSPGDIGAR